MCRNGGNVVAIQKSFGFHFIEKGSARGGGGVDDVAGFDGAHLAKSAGTSQSWRLINSAEVVGVPPHVLKGPRGGVGVRKGGDAGIIENRIAGFDVAPAH